MVPATVFTAQTTYTGLKYVATVTAPQVWSFTANKVVPTLTKVAQDIITWVREMVSSIFTKSNYPSVPSQYRVETV